MDNRQRREIFRNKIDSLSSLGMMIPILQMQEVRLKEGQKFIKLWQTVQVTLRPSCLTP